MMDLLEMVRSTRHDSMKSYEIFLKFLKSNPVMYSNKFWRTDFAISML